MQPKGAEEDYVDPLNEMSEEEAKAISAKYQVGDVVNIPPEVKHWHGAAPDSAFQHLALEVPGEGTSNEWCERVDPEEYGKLK